MILLLTALIIGATLRFATLGAQSYWSDEAQTVQELRLSLGALLHQIHVNETTPPLYFLLAWVWAKVFGTGELGLRALSALCGTALLPLTYLCARELISRWGAVLACALAAVNPFLIWYSQEARAYALFALVGAASMLFCLRARKRSSVKNLVWWTLSCMLALMTHFFAGFLIAAEVLLVLHRVRTRGVMLACAAIAAVQLALLPLAIGDTSQSLSWITALPLSARIQQIPVQFGLGTLYESSLVKYGLTGAGALSAVVLWLLWAKGRGAGERRAPAIAAALAGATVLVPIVLALLGRDYVIPRNLVLAWVPLAIVLAAACTLPRARLAGGALAVLLLGGFTWAQLRISSDPHYQRQDWRAVAEALGRPSGTRAIVPYDRDFATVPLEIYLSRATQIRAPSPLAISELDVIGSSWQTMPAALPPGVRLLATRRVDDLLVARFTAAGDWRSSPAAILQRAHELLGPAPSGGPVLLQRTGS